MTSTITMEGSSIHDRNPHSLGRRLQPGNPTISVTDNGIGIPAGQHHSIFDNFHRAHRAHRAAGYTGTGLGLGICQRIVQRHGGTITATDNPAGAGSRFVCTLPAAGATTPGAHTGDSIDTERLPSPPASSPVS